EARTRAPASRAASEWGEAFSFSSRCSQRASFERVVAGRVRVVALTKGGTRGPNDWLALILVLGVASSLLDLECHQNDGSFCARSKSEFPPCGIDGPRCVRVERGPRRR